MTVKGGRKGKEREREKALTRPSMVALLLASRARRKTRSLLLLHHLSRKRMTNRSSAHGKITWTPRTKPFTRSTRTGVATGKCLKESSGGVGARKCIKGVRKNREQNLKKGWRRGGLKEGRLCRKERGGVGMDKERNHHVGFGKESRRLYS